jgi:hypothetical protein
MPAGDAVRKTVDISAAPATEIHSVLERQRRGVGLAPLPLSGRHVIEEAIADETPAGVRLAELLDLGEEVSARMAPDADFDSWGGLYRRLDALAYAIRLMEAQIVAGNTGAGMMLPNPDLEV